MNTQRAFDSRNSHRLRGVPTRAEGGVTIVGPPQLSGAVRTPSSRVRRWRGPIHRAVGRGQVREHEAYPGFSKPVAGNLGAHPTGRVLTVRPSLSHTGRVVRRNGERLTHGLGRSLATLRQRAPDHDAVTGEDSRGVAFEAKLTPRRFRCRTVSRSPRRGEGGLPVGRGAPPGEREQRAGEVRRTRPVQPEATWASLELGSSRPSE